jgi:hypothetical protein
MAETYIVWDAIFSADSVTEKSVDKTLSLEMDKHIPPNSVEEVLVWNFVMEGQKTRRTGTSNGLRYLIPIDGKIKSEIEELVELCKSFNSPLCSKSIVSFADVPMIPLDRQRKNKFPLFGKIALQTRFTHGMGLTDSVAIQNARRQTPKTKDGLNPIGKGNKIGSKDFSTEFKSLFSDPYWFLVRPTLTIKGIVNPADALSDKTDGGMYMVNYDLTKAIGNIIQKSEGKWWKPLDSSNLELNPRLEIHTKEVIDSQFDPSQFLHHDSKIITNSIKTMLEIERMQVGNEDNFDDLEYIANRTSKPKRPSLLLTGKEHGLVSGLEHGLIGTHFLGPWLAEEMYNCLAMFLLLGMPKYWKNGNSRILVIYSEDSITLDQLIENRG